MTERNDAGIAEDQVERYRKQPKPHDVGHDQVARWEDEGAGERGEPEDDLAPMPARVRSGMISNVG